MTSWVSAALAVTIVTAACGGATERPRGEPLAVVRAAPDRTFAAGSARVEAAAPDANSAGVVRFTGPSPSLALTGRGASKGYPELAHPRAVVDLVRGALDVESYGGVAIRGTSTFRYEAVVNVERAVATTPPERRGDMEAFAAMLGASAFYVDVWIDDQGRLRRVQLPVEKTTLRPGSRDRRQPELLTVDFFAFGSQ